MRGQKSDFKKEEKQKTWFTFLQTLTNVTIKAHFIVQKPMWMVDIFIASLSE